MWAPSYASSEELAAFVRISGSADAAQLGLAVAAASRAIDRACSPRDGVGRQFGQVDAPEARYYTARYDRDLRWVVPVDDLMTLAGMSLAFDSAGDRTFATSLSVPLPRPVNAAAHGRPWTELLLTGDDSVTAARDAVRVTASWGWSAVPDAVKQACLLQASRLLIRRDSPYGVAGSPQTGSELRLLARVDPDVEVSLKDYVRRGRVVFA